MTKIVKVTDLWQHTPYEPNTQKQQIFVDGKSAIMKMLNTTDPYWFFYFLLFKQDVIHGTIYKNKIARYWILEY